ncbi:MAG: helix-turn-helix transcriptional regulator [Gammaproteobacteria bacterium]|nr:helix-turn-helix transcriptional regulator [Gammaproteobacteria bacterium]
MNTTDIGQTIRECRKKSGLSQLELAQLAGVGKTAIFDIEKGKPTVQLDTLMKVLETLNIQLQLLTPFNQSTDQIT